ncbi:Os11g0294400, partial [Oryza sativa Japonica Group]
VMLCKSSPACPNCKFVQPSVPAPAMPRTPPRRRLEATVKPLETLSLLH